VTLTRACPNSQNSDDSLIDHKELSIPDVTAIMHIKAEADYSDFRSNQSYQGRNGMQAHIEEPSDVIVVFPMERAREVQPPTEVIVPAALRRRRCSVLPLRRGEAARRAALLVKLRWLHVEIQALNARDNAPV
jgi:hypothetical protein